ncbi:hypothetical protein D3C78_1798460 [compost metagenome]
MHRTCRDVEGIARSDFNFLQCVHHFVIFQCMSKLFAGYAWLQAVDDLRAWLRIEDVPHFRLTELSLR